MEYVDNGDSTVTDKSTGLMWPQNDGGTMDWVEALEYADKSELAGHSDWRLPNSKELQSLVDYGKQAFPAINTDFFKTSLTSKKEGRGATPVHVMRPISLQPCSEDSKAYHTWSKFSL